MDNVLHLVLPRRLGQHFLIAEPIVERLAEAACGEHAHRVIEIGPGRGALTRRILARTDELHAIELDTALAEHLRRVFASEPKLHVHEADVLETDLSEWGAATIVGNLPYYITSPIITSFTFAMYSGVKENESTFGTSCGSAVIIAIFKSSPSGRSRRTRCRASR